MAQITCVSRVPKGQSDKLRQVLMAENTAPLIWRERKGWFSSEFYFSGRPSVAMKTQAHIAEWLATTKRRPPLTLKE